MSNITVCAEWISPKESLPKIPKGSKWVAVLVSIDYEDGSEAIFTDKGFCWDMIEYNERSFLNDCVNHWMYPVEAPSRGI